MIIIDIEKKLKAYSGQQVLKFKGGFTAGAVVKMHGPSGAGKTTLLKIIAGFIQPERGTIMVEDDTWLDTAKNLSLPPQRRKAGFVFQDYALFPNMTVQRHLEYATKDIAWINRLLTIGQLEPFAGHKPLHLSGGQQQRLSILRALAIKPKLLLMDEPFSALDEETKTLLIRNLQALLTEMNTTTLIVSHNRHELDAFGGSEVLIS